ncbi:hypothetical protein AYO44_02420 [Planctomycetaceae bacterium SCGC AG-212-F19]|nr:hypothetical protein AYO44_02420 [Planctomycetaceae bacterium SCGC AG-212-F19]
MDDETNFLAAINADPLTDAPRLAYADWLNRRGDVRGEFIRVQCQLAGLAEDDPHIAPLRLREEALLQTRRQDLLGPLSALPVDVRYERGLVVSITLSGIVFLEHAATLFAHAPLREVCLKDAGTRIATLAQVPELGRLERLWLTFNEIDSAGIQALAESPHLGKLTTLNLGHNRLGDAGVAALAASQRLPSLRHLWLAANAIGDAGVQTLARSPLLGQLETLRLNGNCIGDAGVQALADSHRVTGLVGLHLGKNPFGDDAAAALANSPHLQGLCWLVVKKCNLSERGEQALRRRFLTAFNREIVV